MVRVIPSPESSDLWLRRSGRTAAEGGAGASHRSRLSEAGIIGKLTRLSGGGRKQLNRRWADDAYLGSVPPMQPLVNLSSLIEDAKCYELIRQHRWPDGGRCPTCDGATAGMTPGRTVSATAARPAAA